MVNEPDFREKVFVHAYKAQHTDKHSIINNNELFEPGKDIENNLEKIHEKEHNNDL